MAQKLTGKHTYLIDVKPKSTPHGHCRVSTLLPKSLKGNLPISYVTSPPVPERRCCLSTLWHCGGPTNAKEINRIRPCGSGAKINAQGHHRLSLGAQWLKNWSANTPQRFRASSRPCHSGHKDRMFIFILRLRLCAICWGLRNNI